MSKQWNGNPGSPIKLRTNRQTEDQRRRPDQIDEEEIDDAWTRPKPHTSAVRYDRSRSNQTTMLPERTRVLPQRRFDAGRFVTIIGLCMIVMLLGFMALSWLGSWWTTQTNDWTYGRPRTAQYDVVVGHNDNATHKTHFIVENLNRHVVIIEIPGGDTSKSVIYSGPTLVGDGQDLTPVTLTFDDVNGDGKPDMQLHILDQVIVYLNDGKRFVSASQQQQ
jgi:hypothetical protein